VPKFGDPNYASGYYGTMFDWRGWQTGDAFLRQGCAIADRNDVIFGGRDWMGNNLSMDLKPAFDQGHRPVTLELQSTDVFDIGVPVQLELKLVNTSDSPVVPQSGSALGPKDISSPSPANTSSVSTTRASLSDSSQRLCDASGSLIL